MTRIFGNLTPRVIPQSQQLQHVAVSERAVKEGELEGRCFLNGETTPGFEYMAITSDAAGTLLRIRDNFWTDTIAGCEAKHGCGLTGLQS